MRRQQGGDRRRTGRVDRSERTAVFGKTKLCKFHILGVCSKGDECNFAHEATELHQLPDLAKTKVCKALINTGRCDDPECRYAHNRDELRDTPSVDPNLARSHAPASPFESMGQPNASPGLPFNPNFEQAFGQSGNGMPQGMPQDPQAQAAVLQQLAAQLSMQAAMIQAAHANGWSGQQPGAPSSVQWLSQPQAFGGGEVPHRDTRSGGRPVPVELAALTPQPNPSTSSTAGRQHQHGEWPQQRLQGDASSSAANGRQQRRINTANGRNKGFRADGPRPGPPVGQSAQPYEPVKLPTDFEQDSSALQLGSRFHPAQSSQAPSTNAWSSPMLGPTIREPEDSSPYGGALGPASLFELSGLGSASFELSGLAEPDDGERRPRLESYGGEKRLQDTPVLGGIMVKHTFLDIQPEGPKAGMRSVQTHSGSLCLMTSRDEDDDDDQ